MLGGLGWPEAGVLLLLALFVFGPERLPGIAEDAGRTLRKVRNYLRTEHAGILKSIRDSKQLDDDTAAKLKDALTAFGKQFA